MKTGRVVSIHIHPDKAGAGMIPLAEIDAVAGKGLAQDKRYFGRLSSSGEPGRRQVTLIEREQIEAHAAALGADGIAPGAVRSNLETEGIELVPLAGQRVQIGEAQLLIGVPRDPCEKMNAVLPGLRGLMEGGRQGVLAQVVVSGKIRTGDPIRVLP